MSADMWVKLKTFVGLDDPEEDIYEDEEIRDPQQTAEKARAPRVHQPAAPAAAAVQATPARSNIIGLPASQASEVVVIEPRSFDEALAILDNLRARKAVILNLMGLDAAQSQRLVDFVSGACHALDGHQEKIGESIFLFTPSNVVINTFHSERDWMGSQQPKDLFWRVR